MTAPTFQRNGRTGTLILTDAMLLARDPADASLTKAQVHRAYRLWVQAERDGVPGAREARQTLGGRL